MTKTDELARLEALLARIEHQKQYGIDDNFAFTPNPTSRQRFIRK